jgi:hypothetical protein
MPCRTTIRCLSITSRSAPMVYTDQLPYSKNVGNVIARGSQYPFGGLPKTRYDRAQALRSKHPISEPDLAFPESQTTSRRREDQSKVNILEISESR